MLDVYVWSMLDEHEVLVDGNGMRLLVAKFSDKRVAENFRDWLTGYTIHLIALMDELAEYWKTRRMGKQNALCFEITSLIMTRRQHPAQLLNDPALIAVPIK